MFKAYKYQLNPTKEQEEFLNNTLGSARFIYNLALETKIAAYQSGKNYTAFDLINQIKDLKKDLVWLREPLQCALQQSILNLNSAFANFYKNRAAFPKFKKKRHKQSFRISEDVKINFDEYKVFVPKIKWINFFRDRHFVGEIRSATISRTTTGKYFISILVQDNKTAPIKKEISEAATVGIDLGIKHFATLSTGEKIDNPKYLFSSLKRLRVEQRTLKRRFKKGAKEQSKNYQKQKLTVAKLYEKISNQRCDFLHKLSTSIINSHDTICIEDLNVAGMVKNKRLSRAISDASWGEFIRQLEYKSGWYGKNILQIGRFEPSSKMCSCGEINNELTLKEREWTCVHCGSVHNRDVLAANNIKTFGLRAKPLSVNVVQ